MESISKCPECNQKMSFYGDDPSPVELECTHEVCLPCLNKKCDWSPQQKQKNEIDYICPVKDCGINQKLCMSYINKYFNNIRKKIQGPYQNAIQFKCSQHPQKQIEFFCQQCKKFLCSFCLLIHSDHSKQINVKTDQEILQDTQQLIELSTEVIHQISKNIDNLQKIVSKQKEFSSDELIQIILEAVKQLAQPILMNKQIFKELNVQYSQDIFTFDSKIITNQIEEKILLSLLPNVKKSILLLRGSVDGFSSQVFHQKCDKKGKMMCIVKDTNGKIFGGYTELDFENSNHSKIGNRNSFIFIFRDDKTIQKSQCLNNSQREIMCHPNHSFALGGYACFYISDACQNYSKSYLYTTDGKDYQQMNAPNNQNQQYFFKVQDIEYFKLE